MRDLCRIIGGSGDCTDGREGGAVLGGHVYCYTWRKNKKKAVAVRKSRGRTKDKVRVYLRRLATPGLHVLIQHLKLKSGIVRIYFRYLHPYYRAPASVTMSSEKSLLDYLLRGTYQDIPTESLNNAGQEARIGKNTRSQHYDYNNILRSSCWHDFTYEEAVKLMADLGLEDVKLEFDPTLDEFKSSPMSDVVDEPDVVTSIDRYLKNPLKRYLKETYKLLKQNEINCRHSVHTHSGFGLTGEA